MENNDLLDAAKMLAEELEGIDKYTALSEKTKSPELKKIYMENLPGEKKHAAALLNYINRAASNSLK